MKLKRVAGLLLAAPLLLFTACTSAASLSFTANWYSNTNSNVVLSETYEALTYAVAFRSANENANFRVEYDEGTYTTLFYSDNISEAEGNPLGYYYETHLTISGRYYVNGEAGDKFEDSVVSKVAFLGISDTLRPIMSEKTVHSTSPYAGSYKTFYYRTTMVYDASLSKMEYTYLDLSKENAEEENSTVKLRGSGTYLDNEQMLLALRGLDLSTGYSFRTFDVVTHSVRTVKTSSAAATEFTLERPFSITVEGGEPESVSGKLQAYPIQVGFNGNNSGEGQKLTFACCTNPNANTYRNVLLQMETPALRYNSIELGTFYYNLKAAEFNNK